MKILLQDSIHIFGVVAGANYPDDGSGPVILLGAVDWVSFVCTLGTGSFIPRQWVSGWLQLLSG
jgi:hypothetical protein